MSIKFRHVYPPTNPPARYLFRSFIKLPTGHKKITINLVVGRTPVKNHKIFGSWPDPGKKNPTTTKKFVVFPTFPPPFLVVKTTKKKILVGIPKHPLK